MRIGILSQWFDPEPGPAALPGVLARGLVERGHHVRVVTGFPNYPTGDLAAGYKISRRQIEIADGVDVTRVALWPSHDGSAVNRLANYGSFAASSLASGISRLRQADAVWVYNSPISVGIPLWAVRYMHGVPVVTHIMDLWPDTVTASGFAAPGRIGHLADKTMSVWCNEMYRASDSIAYISPSVRGILTSRGVPDRKLAYVPMWADEAVFRPSEQHLRDELGITADQIVLLYAGAMGEAQGLSTLVEACREVDDPRFVCVLAGSGVSESTLREQASDLTNMRFIGRIPQKRMTELCATADLNYVGLRPSPLSEFTMPSKTQSGMAAGRSLLVAADGDVARVAHESQACLVASPEPVSIAAAIERACALGRDGLAKLGRRAATFYQKEFSADRGITQIEELLAKAANTRRGHR